MTTINAQTSKINWSQILSLAALNAVVVFSWIAYNNYQPKILVKFNFTELGFFLALAQGIVMVFIPPIAGILADYLIKKNAKNFIVYTLGVSITAMIFMAVAFVVSGTMFEGWRILLPVLIIIWLISMNIFISPANSMIELFAPAKNLPLVMGVIVLITDLIAALEPSIIVLVDTLGSTLTFVAGGIAIAIAGYFFRQSTKDMVFERPVSEVQKKSNYGKVFLVALLFGIVNGIMMNVFPELLKTKLNIFSDRVFGSYYFVSLILALAAILALPLSKWTEINGISKALIGGLIGSFACIAVILFIPDANLCLIACLLLAACYSLTSVSAFPYALQNLSAKHITYGTGIFFGAAEIGDQVLNTWLASH